MPNPKFKKFWNLAPDGQKSNTLNMYVYGEIMDSQGWFGEESDVVTSEFLKDLQQYPDVDVINVYINSPGGSVYAAAAIRNQLRQHKATIHTWGEGLIASAAVGIMGAAKKKCRHMSNSALLMIHNPSTRACGNAEDMLKAAEVLGKVKNTLLNMYVEDTGQDRELLSELMDKESYLEASEAMKYGFIDVITEDESQMTIENDDTFIYNGVSCAFSNYANPDELKARLTHLAQVQTNKGGNKDMSFDEVMNSLVENQQTVVRNHISGLLAEAKQSNTTLTEEKATLTAELATAKADLAAVQAELAELKNTGTDPEATMLASLPEEARNMILQARQATEAAEAKLAAMAEEKKFNAFKDTLKVYDALPIQDNHIQALYKASQADAEGYQALVELMKVANTAMANGFAQVGSDQGVPTATTAYEEIEQQVKALRAENKELSYNEAFSCVIKENPDLYARYREEC